MNGPTTSASSNFAAHDVMARSNRLLLVLVLCAGVASPTAAQFLVPRHSGSSPFGISSPQNDFRQPFFPNWRRRALLNTALAPRQHLWKAHARNREPQMLLHELEQRLLARHAAHRQPFRRTSVLEELFNSLSSLPSTSSASRRLSSSKLPNRPHQPVSESAPAAAQRAVHHRDDKRDQHSPKATIESRRRSQSHSQASSASINPRKGARLPKDLSDSAFADSAPTHHRQRSPENLEPKAADEAEHLEQPNASRPEVSKSGFSRPEPSARQKMRQAGAQWKSVLNPKRRARRTRRAGSADELRSTADLFPEDEDEIVL